eukprot:2734470-Prymnesium_polylepis.1
MFARPSGRTAKVSRPVYRRRRRHALPLIPQSLAHSPRTASLSPGTRSTAVSTETSCACATFDTLKYTPCHVRTRLHMCAPTP